MLRRVRSIDGGWNYRLRQARDPSRERDYRFVWSYSYRSTIEQCANCVAEYQKIIDELLQEGSQQKGLMLWPVDVLWRIREHDRDGEEAQVVASL